MGIDPDKNSAWILMALIALVGVCALTVLGGYIGVVSLILYVTDSLFPDRPEAKEIPRRRTLESLREKGHQ